MVLMNENYQVEIQEKIATVQCGPIKTAHF